MPFVKRPHEPDLHYIIDDYTDPWKKAPTILLQHGYGRSTRFWYRWIPYLARFYRVVRADLRGLGESATGFDLATGIATEKYLADFNALLDAIGVDAVHYCGESLGGMLGIVFAAHHPERVRSLSLVSAPVFLDGSLRERSKFGYASWEEALRQLGPRGYSLAKNKADRFSPGTDPGLANWFAEQQGSSDVEVLIAMQKFASGLDTTPCLARIAAPVLALYPSHGPITTPEQENLLRAHVRRLRVVHLASQSHNLHLTQAAACATQVLHFAAQQDGIVCHE